MFDPDIAKGRGRFKRAAAGLGAAAAAAALHRDVLGANDRVNIGVIGCGRAGTNHIACLQEMKDKANVTIAAVCDIYEPRKQEGAKLSGGKAFHDYGKMLEMKDLDAVIVATPDHWHAQMCLDAVDAGKDVYCEEPMTLHWDEAKKVKEAVERTGKVLQVGAVCCSDERWAKARELVRAGKLGTLVWSQASITRNSEGDETEIDPSANPKNLDWERFLGPAPRRPFDPERYFRHYDYWDYSMGVVGDSSSCGLYGLQAVLGPEFPKRVVAAGGSFVFRNREVPDTFHMVVDYPSEQTIVIACCEANALGPSTVVRGKEATMSLNRDNISVRPQRIYAAEKEPIKVKLTPVSDPLKEHLKNFLECVRTRKRPNCHADLAYKVTVALALGVRSYREKNAMFFDPEKEQVV